MLKRNYTVSTSGVLVIWFMCFMDLLLMLFQWWLWVSLYYLWTFMFKKAEKLRINAIFHFQLSQIGLSWMVRVCVNLTLFGTRPLTSEKTGVFSAALWNHRILLFFLRKDWKVINAQLKSSAPKILFKTDPGQELRFFYSSFLKIIIKAT